MDIKELCEKIYDLHMKLGEKKSLLCNRKDVDVACCEIGAIQGQLCSMSLELARKVLLCFNYKKD